MLFLCSRVNMIFKLLDYNIIIYEHTDIHYKLKYYFWPVKTRYLPKLETLLVFNVKFYLDFITHVACLKLIAHIIFGLQTKADILWWNITGIRVVCENHQSSQKVMEALKHL